MENKIISTLKNTEFSEFSPHTKLSVHKLATKETLMSNLQNQQLAGSMTVNNGTITQDQRQESHHRQVGMNQYVAEGQQGGSQRAQPSIEASINDTARPPQTSVKTALDMRMSIKSWTLNHYEQLGDWVDGHIPGEEIMQHCGIKRRKDLQALVQVVSQRRKKYLEIQWSVESLPGEGQRALPPLKVGDDGSFRISKTRLARLGIKFPEGAKLRVQKGQDGCLIIQMSGNAKKSIT